MYPRLSAPPFPAPGPRIVVVGTTCSGKTTTAGRLARLRQVPHIELDALMWKPGWVKTETEMFRAKARQALDCPAWVVDGNYSDLRDITWGQATTLVWLDYDLPVILGRLVWRTLRRVITREELWNGNRESISGAFFSKDSLFLFVFPSRKRQRKNYPRVLREDYPHLQVIHLRSPRETRAWLEGLAQPPAEGH